MYETRAAGGDDLQARLEQAGLDAASAIAGTGGAAHALARHSGGIVPDGRLAEGLGHLPVTALRVDRETAEALGRVGLSRVADLVHLPRAPLARRLGRGLVMRLDQALGAQSEPVAAEPDAPRSGVRMTLPEPIGSQEDVMAAFTRLLDRLSVEDHRVQLAVQLIGEIIGFPRHLSQHVGGFVITHGRLDELCPIENAAMDDRTIIEWDKDDIAALGC